MQAREKSSIQVIDRAIVLLEALDQDASMPLTRLSDEADLAPSTTKRILDALATHGLVEQESERGGYRLGPRLHLLVAQGPSQRRLIELARPILVELMRKSGEDVGLAVLHGKHAVIIDREYGPEALKIIEPAADPVTLNCGFRRVLLAYQSETWIEEYLNTTHFPRYTSSTITEKNRLRRELEDIRETGFSVSGGEYIKDARGVAAPVFDVNGDLVATIFVVAPSLRFSRARVRQLVAFVSQAASELSVRLRGTISPSTRHGKKRAVKSFAQPQSMRKDT